MYLKKITIFALFLLIISQIACDSGGSGIPKVVQGGTSSFWLPDFTKDYTSDSSAWYRTNTIVMAVSDNAIFYVEEGQNISTAFINELKDEFENTIYPKVTTYFARPYDVDRNGKVKIVLADLQDGGGSSYIGGYFFNADFYSQASLTSQGFVIKSNQGDIVYINSNPPNINALADAKRILAHEFQHLVNYSEYLTNNNKIAQTDTWINEGLSEAANHLCYGKIDSRITHLNNMDTTAYNGFSLFYWVTNETDNDLLLSYSLSYLFFQYIRSQSALKNNIFKNIVTSQYGNHQAIMDAIELDATLSSSIWGVDTDDRFNRLLLRFYAANTGVINNPLFQYDGEITSLGAKPSVSTIASNISGSFSFYSGGGFLKALGGNTYSPTNSNFIYLAIDSDGNEDTTATYNNETNMDYIAVVHREYTTTNFKRSVTFSTSNSTRLNQTRSLTNISTQTFNKVTPLEKPQFKDPTLNIPPEGLSIE